MALAVETTHNNAKQNDTQSQSSIQDIVHTIIIATKSTTN